MAKNTNELQQRIRLVKKYTNIDEWYGVWKSTTDANYNIPLTLRSPGMTVGILVGVDTVEEYWYNGGISDVNLVRKIPTDLKSDAHYIHDQYAPADIWEITHNLEKFPTIQIVDSSNKVIEGHIEHENENKSIAMFNGKFSGKAICN